MQVFFYFISFFIMNITILKKNILLSNILYNRITRCWFKGKVYNCYDTFLKKKCINSDLYIISNLDEKEYETSQKIIKHIRELNKTNCPIIVLWNKNNVNEVINILNLWADDYLWTPFSYDELIARIRALIRRAYKINYDKKIIYKKIVYNYDKKTIKYKWKNINLTTRELQLAEYLLINKWKLISKEELINYVWWEYDLLKVTDNNINVTISKLRKKLWNTFNLVTYVNRWYVLE